MSKKTIGILMPGDMGHGCGKVFLDNNLAVISALDGRSNRTKKLSESAGIGKRRFNQKYCKFF